LPKVPLNITVDKEVLERFKDLCENNDIKISTKVNTLMKEWVELQKDKE
jgi:antitoxin component of RelBE/YafQ-DinJ toxin-antitoxin module